MTYSEILITITTIAAVISCIMSFANSWKISIVKRETNSMKDELVNATRIGSEAIGEARGRKLQIKDHKERTEK